MTNLQRLASHIAAERVPEASPEIHREAVGVLGHLQHWLETRPWYAQLSEKEAGRIEARLAEHTTRILDLAEEMGAAPLRAALDASTHEYMLAVMTQDQLTAIEAGVGPI